MHSFLALLTGRLDEWAASLLGSFAHVQVVGSLRLSELAVSGFYLVLAILLHAIARWYVRHRQQPPDTTKISLIHRAFAAVGKPLYLLIWLLGAYVAAVPLLIQLRPEQGLDAVQRGLDSTFGFGAFVILLWFVLRTSRMAEAHVAAWAATTPSRIDDLLVPLLGSSFRILVIIIAVILGLPMLGLPAAFASVILRITSIVLIIAVAVLLVRAVSMGQAVVLIRFDMAAPDNLRARKVYTQLHVITRVIYVLIGLLAVASILMLFQEVRHVGTSLLASAGLVGIIAGVAAQKTLANLFAGFQIALAQPMRQDDVVIVEGEWGRIEEITLTYVVVHIWDDRRLVLPLSYFIEKPFQNWTRTSAELMGSVFVWVDYTFPVDAGRAALKSIIETHPLWDKRFWNLQVSDASDRTMQLRILATSADSSKSWDLRCAIREQFIAFIQENHPASLPRLRTDMAPD
jgi:small-conductance mechanosensitive channel